MRIAVLASGEGTTLQAVLDAVKARAIDVDVALVISNNRDSGALRRARAAGVPTLHLSRLTEPDERRLDQQMCDALTGAGTELVVLAGYMRKLGPETLGRFAGAIINTHPALLPRHGGPGMYGRHVHEAVVRSGDRESGVTIHLVEGDYDTGPAIAQKQVALCAGDSVDTVEAKVRAVERPFLCEVLQRIATSEIPLRRAAG